MILLRYKGDMSEPATVMFAAQPSLSFTVSAYEVMLSSAGVRVWLRIPVHIAHNVTLGRYIPDNMNLRERARGECTQRLHLLLLLTTDQF